MLRNYLKTTLRYLWRNKLFTTLNILGLAIGISASWLIYRMVDYEYSYDKKVPDADRIYQLVSKDKWTDKDKWADKDEKEGSGGVAKPVVNVLLNNAPGAELVVPMFYQSFNTVTVPDEVSDRPREFDRETLQVTTLPTYFDLIEYRWLAGNKKTALDAPDKVVLTEKKAREYFPNYLPDQILGKTIIYDGALHCQVSGIVVNLDYPNSFNQSNTEFRRVADADLNNNRWMAKSSNDLVFFKAAKNANPQHIIEQVNALNKQFGKELFEQLNFETWYDVLPLPEKHFASRGFKAQTRVASKPVLYGLMCVGIFLLLLACINYINLSTALLPQRAREIGVRKTLGSTSKSLIYRFVGETFIVTLLALAFSFLLTFVAVNIFAPFLPQGMFDHIHYGRMLLFVLVLITIISLLSGLYPAILSTRVEAVKILKGQTEKALGRDRLSFRKGLIVFQFLVAQVFIISTIIMGEQLQYSLNKDLGFSKEAIITVDVPFKIYNRSENKNKESVLQNELGLISSLRGFSLGDKPMSMSTMTSIYSYLKDTTELQQIVLLKHIDTAYLRVYNMQLLAGRNIRSSDTINEMIINEKSLAAYGFSTPEEAIGEALAMSGSNKTYPIVGVVKDFHQLGMQSEIHPTVLLSQRNRLHAFNIKLPSDSKQWPAAISAVEKAWNTVYADVPFEYKFYDEVIATLYEEEKNTQTLIRATTAITIFISCLGLFGLSTLTAFQRTKEIGIRKVLGASVSSIVGLLSKDFVKLVLLAIVIAIPMAWWMMNKWLEDFAYKIEIQWWMFALAGLAAVIVAIFTVAAQAIRAALANPVESLRDE